MVTHLLADKENSHCGMYINLPAVIAGERRATLNKVECDCTVCLYMAGYMTNGQMNLSLQREKKWQRKSIQQ